MLVKQSEAMEKGKKMNSFKRETIYSYQEITQYQNLAYPQDVKMYRISRKKVNVDCCASRL